MKRCRFKSTEAHKEFLWIYVQNWLRLNIEEKNPPYILYIYYLGPPDTQSASPVFVLFMR